MLKSILQFFTAKEPNVFLNFPNFTSDILSKQLPRRANIECQWLGSDSEPRHNEYKNKFSNLITYKPEDFTYKFNSHGFRCDEFNTPTNHKKILYTGCSMTEGIGLPVEHIWSSQLNKMLFGEGSPLFNIAINGNSVSGIIRQLIAFLNSADFKPDYVLINFPPLDRDEFHIQLDDGNFDTVFFLPSDELLHWVRDRYSITQDTYNSIHTNFKHFSDKTFLSIVKDTHMNLLLLDLFLKSKNIKYKIMTWNAWSGTTHKLINKLMSDLNIGQNFINVPIRLTNSRYPYDCEDMQRFVKEYGNKLNLQFKQHCARDYMHYGPDYHYRTAALLYSVLTREKFI